MEFDSFENSLHAFTHRAPFQSFSVELSSGERFTVDHPEALIVRAGTAVYIAPTGKVTLFDHTGVTRLMEESETRSAS